MRANTNIVQTKKLISFSFFSENSISILMMSKKVSQKQKTKNKIQIHSTKKRKNNEIFPSCEEICNFR